MRGVGNNACNNVLDDCNEADLGALLTQRPVQRSMRLLKLCTLARLSLAGIRGGRPVKLRHQLGCATRSFGSMIVFERPTTADCVVAEIVDQAMTSVVRRAR